MTSDDRRALLPWLLAAVGLTAIGWLVSEIGVERLLTAARGLAPWLPVVFALEGARWLADAGATWRLYGARRRSGSPSRLVVASFAAYPVTLLFPAGRVAGEVLKAASMRHDVGLGRAAAAAVTMQALPLLAGAVVSLPCITVAWLSWGASWLTGAIALQAMTALALGGAVLWASSRPVVGRLARRVSEQLGAATDDVQRALTEEAVPMAPAFVLAVASRALLAAQIVLLAHAVGVSGGLSGGLLTVGLHFVGQAAGDLVPAQLGATDGALVLGSEALGASSAGLVAAGLSFHASQLLWAGIGAVIGVRLRL
ncbi:MAG TPA: hypothetical protein ENK57_08195 [Polyangiaceae bacterium]|nr:hypothetical protein [Polyangiaceae bacterium]